MDNSISAQIEALKKEIEAIKARTEHEHRSNAILLRLGNLLAENINASKDGLSNGFDALDKNMKSQMAFVQNNQELITEKAELLGRAENRLVAQCKDILDKFVELQKDMVAYQAKFGELDKRIIGIHDELDSVKEFLKEETKSTLRLKEGYDFHILKNFARQICREIHNTEKEIQVSKNDEVKEQLQFVIDDLKELLDRNSIFAISPRVGEPYRGHEEIAECLQEKVETDNAALHGTIAEVTREGFVYRFNDGQERVLEPAKVKLYECRKMGAVFGGGALTPEKSNAGGEEIPPSLKYPTEAELAKGIGASEGWQAKLATFVRNNATAVVVVLVLFLIVNAYFVWNFHNSQNEAKRQAKEAIEAQTTAQKKADAATAKLQDKLDALTEATDAKIKAKEDAENKAKALETALEETKAARNTAIAETKAAQKKVAEAKAAQEKAEAAAKAAQEKTADAKAAQEKAEAQEKAAAAAKEEAEKAAKERNNALEKLKEAQNNEKALDKRIKELEAQLATSSGAAKPAEQPAEQPAAKPAEQPAEQPAAKPEAPKPEAAKPGAPALKQKEANPTQGNAGAGK